ncbi:aminotransferase class V-fold PLP-dependent enzyme [Amycolatopsis sp. OK19-0408]|uniref:Aminotransferase class V-fold PLP-dependent enzyme n=1 Tax=Amycolatopsis iheyensis TaxID=2945988 RepID=A0A9X2NK82_9PSEU|nr:aminotransferase class V-fold PLP-dependent enzyme [Amycolatopsis iheyensis]MCR6487892.1 aminotransferase class V-fold PLP-dependent enzyme [Amycolatopsis iheyensis]
MNRNEGVLHAGPAGLADLAAVLGDAVRDVGSWMSEYGGYDPHPSQDVPLADLRRATADLHERLRDNYPFFHPRYVGQMLKPPHPAAVVGYLSAMLINPNNHALDGGPATAAMEKEVVADLAAMFGLPQHLGHLTSSGTIANLEALFVARETHPGKAIAHSADAHYTHGRMSRLLGVEAVPVTTTAAGTLDLTALEDLLCTGRIGTVVATTGTTGLGAVDPVDEIIALARRYGARVHVDAAYGGYFRLIADDTADGVRSAPFRAIADADSVVIDPHKHGLQPYGCGAVLFRDPSVARHYLHDSPYTYFTSDELHLGEISLECSRAGAAAAALWLTSRVLPLTPAGLGAVLRPGRRAALAWADLITGSEELTLFQPPELDIVGYFPARDRLSEIDRASAHVLDAGMRRAPEQALFVATYAVAGADLARRGHRVDGDIARGRILRSVLMKPESEAHLPDLHREIARLSADA